MEKVLVAVGLATYVPKATVPARLSSLGYMQPLVLYVRRTSAQEPPASTLLQ